MNLSAMFKKMHDLSFLAPGMVDIGKDLISTDFPTCNSTQIYQCYNRVARFLLQHHIILNIILDIYGVETEFRALHISHLDNETLFSPRVENGQLLVCAASDYVWQPREQHLFRSTPSYKSGNGLLRELHGLFQERDATDRLYFFFHSFAQTIPQTRIKKRP